MSRFVPSFRLLSTLLLFLFGGAIVGETVALSMIVSIAGSQVLGKLYLINGLLLFLLPPLFFNNIDRFNRGKLLSIQLITTSAILFVYLIVLRLVDTVTINVISFILHFIYPISYLSKTVLFLTFWTLANDICYTRETKKEFPKIAAWGFAGGLTGALISRALLELIAPDMIIGLWALSFIIAFFFAWRIAKQYHVRLLPKEYIPKQVKEKRGIFEDIKSVLSIDLVRFISYLYFSIFTAIFLIDYLFWKTCLLWFTTFKELASFQFSFYLAHGIITVTGLLFITPYLVSRFGFIKLFSFLPYTLLFGSMFIFSLVIGGFSKITVFAGFIVVQFFRYVIFENAFSPIFQMLFTSISKEKRGRAKTIIEGIIKPSAIIIAGLLLIILHSFFNSVLIIIFVLSILALWIVSRIRTSYTKGFVPDIPLEYVTDDIIAEIGSKYDQKILSLIKEYSRSSTTDLRSLAVKILAQLGSKQALQILISIFESEKEQVVKRVIARSLKNFYWPETRSFIESLLRDKDYRIRSNAVYSLNNMNCHWKWNLKDHIKPLLFENNIRVQIEAAHFLWQGYEKPEKENVLAFLSNLLESKNENKLSAGLYLVCQLKPENWEEILKNHLQSMPMNIFINSIKTIVTFASQKSKIEALKITEKLSPSHIEITGDIIQKIGRPAIGTIFHFSKQAENPQMIFEMVHALRILRDDVDGYKVISKYKKNKETENVLYEWIQSELKKLHYDAYLWRKFKSKVMIPENETCIQVLNDALKEQIFYKCGWALEAMALLEPQGAVALRRKDLDIRERSQRLDMIEIVEGLGASRLRSLIIPLLEFESWAAIAKVGKHFFNFDDVEGEIYHFIKSGNDWICLCALYCLACLPDANSILQKEKKYFTTLIENSNTYLSLATKKLLERTPEKEGTVMDPFKLLETVLFFKKTTLFHNVPAEKLMALAEISELTSYKKGVTISNEDTISDHLYIVKTGSLKIVKVKHNIKAILSIIRSGEAYGEIGLFSQSPRSASAIANEDCEVYVIQRSTLKRSLIDIPEIAYNFLEVFSDKLRKSSEELTLLHSILSEKYKREKTS